MVSRGWIQKSNVLPRIRENIRGKSHTRKLLTVCESAILREAFPLRLVSGAPASRQLLQGQLELQYEEILYITPV